MYIQGGGNFEGRTRGGYLISTLSQNHLDIISFVSINPWFDNNSMVHGDFIFSISTSRRYEKYHRR